MSEQPSSSDAPQAQPEAPESPPPVPPRPRRRRRVVRVTLWLTLASFFLLGISLGALAWALSNLAHPDLKAQIQSAALEKAGARLDYETLSLDLLDGELRLEGLEVATPPRFAEHAPTLLKVSDIAIDIDVDALQEGQIVVPRAEIGDVQIALVQDELGANSVTAMLPPSEPKRPPPRSKPTPLSGLLDLLPPDPVQLPSLKIGSISAEVITLKESQVAQRIDFGALAIDAEMALADRVLDAKLHLRNTGERARLKIEDAAEPTLRGADFAFNLELAVPGERRVQVAAQATLFEQGLDPKLRPLREVIDLVIDVQLQPKQGQSIVRIEKLSALDSALNASLTATVEDGPKGGAGPIEADGEGTLKLASLPLEVPGIALGDLDLRFDLDRFAMNGPQLRSGRAELVAKLATLRVDRPGQQVDVDDFELQLLALGASARGAGATVGELKLGTGMGRAAVALEAQDTRADIEQLRLDFTGEALAYRQAAIAGKPSASQVELGVAALRADAQGNHVDARALALKVQGRGLLEAATRRRPLTANISLPIARLKARTPQGQRVDLSGVDLAVGLDAFRPRGRGMFGLGGGVDLELGLDSLRAAASGQRVSGSGVSLKAKVDLTGEEISGTLPIAQLSVVDSDGEETIGLSELALEFETRAPLALDPAQRGRANAKLSGGIGRLRAGARGLGLRELQLGVEKSERGALALSLDAGLHDIDLEEGKRLKGLRQLTLRLATDLRRPQVDLDLGLKGEGGPTLTAGFDADFESLDESLAYRLRLDAGDFTPLLTLFGAENTGGVDWGKTHFALRGDGRFRGLLAPPTQSVYPAAVADPLARLRGKQSLRAELRDVHFQANNLTAGGPRIQTRIESEHKPGGAMLAHLRLDVPEAEVERGAQSISLRGLREEVWAELKELPSVEKLRVRTRTSLSRAEQSFLPGYPIERASIETDTEVDQSKAVVLRSFRLRNPAAGTRIDAQGTLERWTGETRAPGGSVLEAIPGRKALSLEGTLAQDLRVAESLGVLAEASGTLSVPFQINSGDLVGFRLAAQATPEDIALTTRDRQISLRGLKGLIPISEEIAFGPAGVELVTRPENNEIARTRYFDVNPFLDVEDFVSAETLRVGGEQLGPLAGNFRINGATVALNQLQIGYRKGVVTGQLIVERGAKGPTVLFRGNATGIRPTGSEQELNANAALSMALDTLAVDGRVEVVEIGKDHLLGLLDLLDPYRQNVEMNRVRLALDFGYPESLRMQMKEGLMDVKVELGGIVGAVRIDEIRSIPLAALLEQKVAPLLGSQEKTP